MTGRLTVLHCAPHPDDEALGAPATLLGLRGAGHRVLNLALGLGGALGERPRRRRELEEACRRAGFELEVADPDPGGPLEPALADRVGSAVRAHRPDLVVSPAPEDAHPRHAAVARAVRSVVEGAERPAAWWAWGLWAEVARPTLLVPFGEDGLTHALRILAAHEGELRRTDFARLLRGRAMAAAVVGPERLFGFGSPGIEAPYAELLAEARWEGGDWRAGPPRVLDPAWPLDFATSGRDSPGRP